MVDYKFSNIKTYKNSGIQEQIDFRRFFFLNVNTALKIHHHPLIKSHLIQYCSTSISWKTKQKNLQNPITSNNND